MSAYAACGHVTRLLTRGGAIRPIRTNLGFSYPIQVSGCENAAPLGESGDAGLPGGISWN
jgi:hypothetical protein